MITVWEELREQGRKEGNIHHSTELQSKHSGQPAVRLHLSQTHKALPGYILYMSLANFLEAYWILKNIEV